MHVGMSALARERNDLAAAEAHLRAGQDLGDENGLPQNPYRVRVAMARIRQTEGDLDGALELLAEAERLYANDFSPDVRPVGAIMARVWIVAGRIAEASAWVRAHVLTTDDDLTYVREFEHLTLARLLVAQGTRDPSVTASRVALDVPRSAAGGGRGRAEERERPRHPGRPGTRPPGAAAMPRPPSPRLGVRSTSPSRRGTSGSSSTRGRRWRRCSSWRRSSRRLRGTCADSSPPASRQRSNGRLDQPLIEPLSERELDVLRLLESDLDGPDIARELSVSLATVRTHTRNIYAKLGVNSRRAAVRRAAELGLLSRATGQPTRRVVGRLAEPRCVARPPPKNHHLAHHVW